MKPVLFFGLLTISLIGMGCGSKHSAQSVVWNAPERVELLGGEITEKQTTPLAKLLKDPEAFLGKTLLVEGEVTGRCQGSGCWVSLDTGDPGTPFYAKSSDHSFVFPASCEEKRVRIQGIFSVLRREHDHEGEHDKEAGHTCPEPVYYLEPQAAVSQR